MAFWSLENIWLIISFGFIIIENVIVFGWLGWLAWYRFFYRYDAGAYIEKGNGATVYHGSRARIWIENQVKKVKLAFVPHKVHPAPTMDAIMLGNKGARVEYFIDRYSNMHQIRPRSSVVPILIEDEDGLKQLQVEMPDEKKRKEGWVSKLKNWKGMFIRQVKQFDTKGKEQKVMVALKEIVFEIDDTNDKGWTYNELKTNNEAHQTSTWEKYKGPIVIGIVATVAIAAMVFTGYFIAKITEHTVTSCNNAAVDAIAEKLGQYFSVVKG